MSRLTYEIEQKIQEMMSIAKTSEDCSVYTFCNSITNDLVQVLTNFSLFVCSELTVEEHQIDQLNEGRKRIIESINQILSVENYKRIKKSISKSLAKKSIDDIMREVEEYEQKTSGDDIIKRKRKERDERGF